MPASVSTLSADRSENIGIANRREHTWSLLSEVFIPVVSGLRKCDFRHRTHNLEKMEEATTLSAATSPCHLGLIYVSLRT